MFIHKAVGQRITCAVTVHIPGRNTAARGKAVVRGCRVFRAVQHAIALAFGVYAAFFDAVGGVSAGKHGRIVDAIDDQMDIFLGIAANRVHNHHRNRDVKRRPVRAATGFGAAVVQRLGAGRAIVQRKGIVG